MTKDPAPYIAVDVMTNKVIGRYNNPHEAIVLNPTLSVDCTYKPRKRVAKPKEFPYNG